MRTRNGHENKQKNRKFKHDLFYSERKLHYLCTQKENFSQEMESNKNKYIAVAYRLYVVDNNSNELVEEATDNEPFQFISGYGITLDAFENATAGLNKGEEFDITLSKDEAYGDYEEEHVLDLDKNIFCINGHFDHDNIYKDAIIPLQNEDGNRFLAKVVSVGEDKVRVDLNHPLAGKTLNFKGHIVESREATNEEIQGLINRMSGEGCCCGHHGEDGGDCCCGHHHGDGEGCHHGHGEGCHHGHEGGNGCCCN